MPDPIQLSPEEQQEYEHKSAPINPLRDFSSEELSDLAVKDPTFNIGASFASNPELHGDPATVQKAADALHAVRERGFKLEDLPGPKKIAGSVWDIAKGFGKQAWNYASAAMAVPVAIAGEITGQPESFHVALGDEAMRGVVENLAGSEQAVSGMAGMAERAAGKLGRALHITKPLNQYTPEDKVKALFDEAGKSQQEAEIARGHGAFMTPVAGEVVKELEAGGKPIRPEETAATAAGDPLSWWTFGKVFHAGGKLVPASVTQAATKATQALGETAGAAAGKLIQAGGTALEAGGTASKGAGKVVSVAAPVIGTVRGLATGDITPALFGVGEGFAGAALIKAGEVAKQLATGVRSFGKQVAGEVPVVSPLAQGVRDVAQAAPGAVGDLTKGAAFDVGLAATTAETPEETQGVGIGTVFGALGAGKRIGGHVLSGQLIAPREYGVAKPQPSSGQFTALDAMHNAAFSTAAPGVRARLNAIRQFVKGAAPGTDVFLGGDEASISDALQKSGMSAEEANKWAAQEGFFAGSLPDKTGQPRRVILVKNPDAAPHESFHAVQDVLGEEANRRIDEIVQKHYGNQWETEGETYAKRLQGGPLGNAAWRERILDLSGWGVNAAKEKIYRDIGNRMRGDTPGAEPPPDAIRSASQQEFGRLMDEALSRNSNLTPEEAQSQVWRDVLNPEEAQAEADRYLARELAAENFDMAFKRGEVKGLPGILAQKIGNLVSILGGEPLAGRVSEIGQIQPKFRVTEAVRAATPTFPTPTPFKVAPKPAAGTPPSVGIPAAPPQPSVGPRPVAGTPEARAAEAQTAQQTADAAPETPLAGGTRSPRELLGQVAEAIALGSGIKINYLSAPGEPAAATTSNREARRAIIEVFRTMPPEARALWEKSFFPDRVITTKGGQYQIQGWAPEVFAANAHKMAETLAKIGPEGTALSPYPIDPATGSFTPDGWRQLYSDAATFVANQQAGAAGSGIPLVVPKEMEARGIFKPQVTGATAPLEQRTADFINTLFNFKLPETPRMVKGKIPLNIAGQEVSAATLPGRVEVPVRPRGEYTGEEAQRQGIEGRPIAETNPVRNEIEAAAQKAGVTMPSMIEAIQKLNLENIKEIQHAPEMPEFRGNTLTLTAGFQPKAPGVNEEPESIKRAAVRTSEGKIFTGETHGDAQMKARGNEPVHPVTTKGWVTNEGEFLDRKQAYRRALQQGQITGDEFTPIPGSLESVSFDYARNRTGQAQPPAPVEAVDFMRTASDEDFRAATKDFKGKYGGGPTGWAFEVGASARSAEDLAALRSAVDLHRAEGRKLMSTGNMDDLQKAQVSILKAQLAREAFEAATGTNLEGKPTDASVGFIRKYADPNYEPPMVPEEHAPIIKSVTAQFMPKPRDPNAVNLAAVRDEEGKIFTGRYHAEAMENAKEAGSETDYGNFEDGFVTNSGEWLTRDQAYNRAQQQGQLPKNFPTGAVTAKPNQGRLESTVFQDRRTDQRQAAQFQPQEQVADLTPEEAAKIPGATVHKPYATYARASTAGPDNPWVRSSADPARNADPSNADRALMIQFDTNIQSLGGKITRDEASEYYDKLYSGVRPGYARMEDFWEIPQWMGFVSHVLPDADMYVVRDMAQAKKFLNTAKYGRVLFSAMDVNAEAIKELAKDYDGKFDVGGYTAPGTFKDVPNVVWHNSMPEMAKALGVPYKEGVDYRHFVGADSIPRLTMSSGCKYKCAFCTIEKTVKAAPDNVVKQQAEAIANLHTKLIYLNDKTFGQAGNYQDLADLNTMVKERNPNFEGFVVQTTASQMLKLPAEWLEKSGIKFVELGIESFNDPILRDIRKPATEAQMEASANKLRELGITLIPNVLIGLPGETQETYTRTLDFLKKHSDIISHANIYNLAVYKDTELAKKITTASPGDYDENVREKTFYADPEVHRVFAGDLYSAGQGMLASTPETLVRSKTEAGQAQPQAQPRSPEHLNDIEDFWPGGFPALQAQQKESGIADEKMPAGEPSPSEGQTQPPRRGRMPGWWLRQAMVKPEEKTAGQTQTAFEDLQKGLTAGQAQPKREKEKYPRLNEFWVSPKGEIIPAPEGHYNAGLEFLPDTWEPQDPNDPMASLYPDVYDKGYIRGVNSERDIFIDGPQPNAAQRAAISEVSFEKQKPITKEGRLGRNRPQSWGFQQEDFSGQAQPRKPKDESKLMSGGAAGFTRAWILPTGKIAQLGGQWHHHWLAEDPEGIAAAKKYKMDIPPFEGQDAEGVREQALMAGFVRVNLNRHNGLMTVEGRNVDWNKRKAQVEKIVASNIDDIDRLRVNLLNPDVTDTVDSGTADLFKMDSDAEKLAAIPFLNEAPRTARVRATESTAFRAPEEAPEAPLPPVYSAPEFAAFDKAGGYIGKYRKYADAEEAAGKSGSVKILKTIQGQAQPKATGDLFPDLEEGKRVLTTREVADMTSKEIADHYPESVIPKRRDEFIPSNIKGSPLFKQAKDEDAAVKAFAQRLVEFAKENNDNPGFKSGLKWYSEFVPELKKLFGKNAPLMAELLAATSPQNTPDVNYVYAVDALQGITSGRFEKQRLKYEEGLQKLSDGTWQAWAKRNGLGPEPTPAAFLGEWIDKFNLKPRQSNGKLYGISSVPVLQVLARRWLQNTTGPKTQNFVRNLLGTGHEATIDVWADRTMRRIGYEGVDRWRILPKNSTGVRDADFEFGQKAFREAARQLKVKPDALQGALWFAEKQLWDDNGWSRLDLGDYRKEIPKTAALQAEIARNLNAEKEQPMLDLLVKPRKLK